MGQGWCFLLLILFRLPIIKPVKPREDYFILSLQNTAILQNTAARLVVRARKNEHVTPILKRLHWLPVRARIDFKILLLTFKALHNQAPDYIKYLLIVCKPGRSLRSSLHKLLVIPPTKSKNGNGSFQVAAPKLWNSMSSIIRLASSLICFKSLVKTFLLENCFLESFNFKF